MFCKTNKVFDNIHMPKRRGAHLGMTSEFTKNKHLRYVQNKE